MSSATRRGFIAGMAAAPWLAGCDASPSGEFSHVQGRWLGDHAERGHRVREASAASAAASTPSGARERRTDVLIIGAGIAGLAAARALRRAGIDDFAVLELEDAAGGNSRGHAMHGLPCPLGAHYLPVPGAQAREVQEWLLELGLARITPTGLRWDERQLCHSPQERLFWQGQWQDGLLPAAPRASPVQAQYRLFARRVAEAQQALGFAIPTARARWSEAHAALDRITFAQWLSSQGLTAEPLLTYLDYCCRDDYGAGSASVSAWAGLHYFASRHGFSAPGDDAAATADHDALLTWPEGNAHLVKALRDPCGERVQAGRAVFRVAEDAQGVDAWAFVGDGGALEHWHARHLVLALPLFVAARILQTPPPALREAAAQARYAPWMVANLLLAGPLLERHGAPLSWDNVVHGSPSLGYVNAQQQSLAPLTGERLLTAYWSFPVAQRARLLAMTWQQATQLILDDLRLVHPDLSTHLRQIDLVRHGHAMSIPAPGVRSSAALAALAPGAPAVPRGRVHFAHADLSAYSVFEEAFTHGDGAGRQVAQALRGSTPPRA